MKEFILAITNSSSPLYSLDISDNGTNDISHLNNITHHVTGLEAHLGSILLNGLISDTSVRHLYIGKNFSRLKYDNQSCFVDFDDMH